MMTMFKHSTTLYKLFTHNYEVRLDCNSHGQPTRQFCKCYEKQSNRLNKTENFGQFRTDFWLSADPNY